LRSRIRAGVPEHPDTLILDDGGTPEAVASPGTDYLADLALCLPYRGVSRRALAMLRSLSLGLSPDNPKRGRHREPSGPGCSIYPHGR